MQIVKQPMSACKADPEAGLQNIRQGSESVLLTSDAKGEVVVIVANDYQRLRQAADQWEAITAIKESLADVTDGRTQSAQEAIDRLAKKHNLSEVESAE